MPRLSPEATIERLKSKLAESDAKLKSHRDVKRVIQADLAAQTKSAQRAERVVTRLQNTVAKLEAQLVDLGVVPVTQRKR